MEKYRTPFIGISIVLCCIRCISTASVSESEGLDSDEDAEPTKNSFIFYQGVRGRPGLDFPVLTNIPKTVFSCKDVETGYYADLETGCQVFHICEEGRKISFLCPNGTIFQQSDLICDWWFKVNCTNSPLLYEESSEQLKVEKIRRKAARRISTTHINNQKRKNDNYIKNYHKKDDNRIDLSKERNYSKWRDETNPTTSTYSTTPRINYHEKSQFNRKIDRVHTFDKNDTTKVLYAVTESSSSSKNPGNDYVNIFVASKQKILKDSSSRRRRPAKTSRTTTTTTTTVLPVLNDSNENIQELDETQIPEESASFVGKNYRNINEVSTVNYPNHKETYEEIKDPILYLEKYSPKITPVTSQYLTTQSFNNGKTFLGSSVGVSIPKHENTYGRLNNYKEFDQNRNLNYDNFISTIAFNTASNTITTTTPILDETPSTTPVYIDDTPWTRKLTTEIVTDGFNELPEPINKETNYFKDLVTNSMTSSSRTTAAKPRPFAVLSTKATITESSNSESEIDDLALRYPFFKISTASPFTLPKLQELNSIPVETTTTPSYHKESAEVLRPGLVVPSSVSPQSLHTLATYFENALNNNTENESASVEKSDDSEIQEKLKALLSNMTRYGYKNLFKNENTSLEEMIISSEIVQDINPASAGNSSEIRKYAKIFSKALTEYLEDPSNFRKTLVSIRPTEPPHDTNFLPESELLNFSEDDTKSNFTSYNPLWSYLSTKKPDPVTETNNYISDSETLKSADSQSFVSQYNNLINQEKQKAQEKNLPLNHWTSSVHATNLWRTTFAVNPYSLNENFQATESYVPSSNEFLTEKPEEEIKYELRVFPKLALNSSQVHGILIDFMNSTTESNKLQRILSKLNTTQDEFLNRMKKIEENPLTRRLVLLLIKECEIEKTEDSSTESTTTVQTETNNYFDFNKLPLGNYANYVSNEQDQDTRALQLLNSLYNIATKFGR